MSEDPASLSKLHDIVVPDAVPWWPPAPGWFVIFAILIGLALRIAMKRYQRWRADAYRRAALRELATAGTPAAVMQILRRAALAFTPRETVSRLHGTAWTDWLAGHLQTSMPNEARDAMNDSIYRPQRPDSDFNALRNFAADWIRNHRRPC